MKKNDIIRLCITSLTADGDGVGRSADGMVVFVPNAAVGDTLDVRVIKVKQHIAYGRVESVVVPSPDRIVPDCPVARACGGCVYRHISYDAECRSKQQKVLDAVTRIGGLQPSLVKAILPCERRDGYRNKAMIPVALESDGVPVIGFYARHSHRVVPCADCALSPPVFNRIAADFLAFMRRYPELVYTAERRCGIRHLYLRYAEMTDEVMVCVVACAEHFLHEDELYDSLTEKYGNIKSIVVNVNPDDTNVILGAYCRTVYGGDTITDVLCGLHFELSPLSFYQVNRAQCERLYALVSRYAALSGDDVLLDLYCGTGTIGLSMAHNCREVIGVEIVSDAVDNARRNAERNGIMNARFLCADAAAAAEQLRDEGISPDVVVVDPPRKGLAPDLIDTIVGMSPQRVVYVSCDPATLARDLKLFSERDYSVKELTPVDMFPRTAHVETVVSMSRQ